VEGKWRRAKVPVRRPSLALMTGGGHASAIQVMFGNEYSEDHRPLTYLRGYPIYATTLVIAIYVVTLFLTTICMAMGYGETFAYYLEFDSRLVIAGKQVWRFLSYGLWNVPSLGFVIDMVMFVWFGLELEKFFGRRIFLRFYTILYLLQPLVYTALGLIRPTTLVGETGAFAIFLAFATLYPNAVLLFNILAKWMAIVLVGIYTLIHIAAKDVVGLIALWVTVTYSYCFVRYEQGRLPLPKFRWPRRGPKLRVLPNPPPTGRDDGNSAQNDVDRLLDKIAKSGIASLSAKERSQLEKASEELSRKDRSK
jgi:membrane associated rhomboid family serine protease